MTYPSVNAMLVVEVSVMSRIIDGHRDAPLVMIAKKASDLLWDRAANAR